MKKPSKQRILAADLFCGAGGTSLGLSKACQEMGFDLDLIAINHWPVAISSHQANHPYAKHLCQNLDQVDPKILVPGGRLNLLVASPECTHHSVARGGRPMNDQSRASAWTVCRWAESLYIDNIVIENVKEFRTWGPLGVNKRPMRKLRGQLYFNFLEALRSLGYRVQDKILNCADYGDPTTRERLFIIARRGGRKIFWPRPTHCSPEKLKKRNDGLFNEEMKPWVPARTIIDWTIPGKSIFNRKKPLAAKTLQRIYAGLEKFGGPNAEPFLIVLRQHMDAQSIDSPLPTLTASGKHVALCEPVIVPFFGERGGQEPRSHSIHDPLPTVTGHGAGALVEPVIVNMKGKSDARSVDKPLPAQTTKNHLYVAEALIIPQFGEAHAKSVEDPLGTITTTSRGIGLLETEGYMLPQHSGGELRPVEKPVPTIATEGAISVVETVGPFLIDANHGAIAGQCPKKEATRRVQSVDAPLPTVTTKRNKALIEPLLMNIDHRGGNGIQVRTVDSPVPTQTTKQRTALVESCIVKYNGTATATSVDAPLHTVSTKDRFALVTTDEGTFVLDIRLRMLKTHELAAAMSMKGYSFKGKLEEQVKQIGNAVPTETAKALITEVLQ